jgi:hypothetical protein
MALIIVMVTLQAQVTVSKTGPDDNLARNADVSESDPGWGGGSSKTDLVDGIRTYDGEWARGLAFQSGVWKQVTLNFGKVITFDRIIQWYHGGMNNNEAAAYRFQYWNGEDWVDFFETFDSHAWLKYPEAADTDWWYYWSTPYENSFSPVTTNKLRIWNFPRSGSHTWLYEVEVYQGKKIEVPDQSVIMGNPVELNINTSLLTQNDDIIAYQFSMYYDPQNLEFLEADIAGTISQNGSVITNSDVPGQLRVSFMTATPLTGEGTLLKLKFNTPGEGEHYCSIYDFLYNTTAVTQIQQGKIIALENIPPIAYLSYPGTEGFVQIGDSITIYASFNEAMAENPVPQIMLSGADYLAATNMTRISETEYRYVHHVVQGHGVVHVSMATGTDIPGNVVQTTPGSGESFAIIRPGDVDDNNLIQAYDAALTLQYSVNLDPLPAIDPLPWEMWRIKTADVDKTDDITANDASMILRHSAGLINSFQMDAPRNIRKFEASDVSISFIDNELVFQSAVDLYGLNLTLTEHFGALGQPIILNKNMMSATNITETTYKIGLATPYSPDIAEVFMKIPVVLKGYDNLIFELIVNTKPITLKVEIPTGDRPLQTELISIYPNPGADMLYFNGVSDRAMVIVSDITGKKWMQVQAGKNGIDVGSLPKGIYNIIITDNQESVVRKYIRQ